MTSLHVRWVPLNDSGVQTYRIHRSMIGFKTTNQAPFGLINGDTLILKINNETTQTITFTSDMAILDLVSFLNTKLSGARAYKSNYDNSLVIRSNYREAPGYIKIVGGTCLPKLGEYARQISEKSEVKLIAEVSGSLNLYEDLDGAIQDFYGISTVDDMGNISRVSSLIQAIGFVAPICVVEGKVVDLQGQRLADVKVTAKIVNRPQMIANHSAIVQAELSVLTGEDGRFSLPLLQKSQVIFEINDTRISDPIEIPQQNYIYFDDLPIYEDYGFKDYNP